MPVYKLLPACKDYLWGGQRLKTDFGIQSGLDPLSEAWVLSCHPDGPSLLADGPYAGLTLPEYIEQAGPGVLGTNCRQFEDFPLLVKLIDAKQNLSVQVHPSDEYALAREGQYGKTEMWVVLDAEPGASLYCGFEREVTREEFVEHIEAGTLTEILHKRPVKKGDLIFIPSGTLHAIGAGLVIAEIQQNSNVTYRVFDYGRVGADGKPRFAATQAEIASIQEALERVCLDYDGDGEVHVAVNAIQIDYTSTDLDDAAIQVMTTNVDKLNAGFYTRQSGIFLLDDPENFQMAHSALAFLDGSMPPEGALDWEEMTIPWRDWEGSAGVELEHCDAGQLWFARRAAFDKSDEAAFAGANVLWTALFGAG